MSRGLEDDQGALPAAISIAEVLRGMGRRKFFIAAMALSAFIAALGVVNIAKPVYTTQAQVLVADFETPFDRVQSGAGTVGPAQVTDRELATHIAVISSEDLGRRVVTALDLAANPNFNGLLGGMGTLGKLKLRLGFGDDPRLKTPERRALDAYNDSLTIYPVPASNVIAIKVVTGEAEIAAKVANTLAETYVNYTRELASQPTERARQWLSQQIDGLRKKVAASDAAVEEFRNGAGLFQGQASTLGNQQLSELNSQITLAEAAKGDARSRADSIRSLLADKGSVDASADVLSSAVIQQMKQLQAQAQSNVAELSAVYLDNHPKMIAALQQLDNVNRRIRSEALKIVEGLEEQANIAESREQSLRQSLEQAKGRASASNLDDVKLKALERDAQANRDLLETMLARYVEASAKLDPSAQPASARISQIASVPSQPSFPRKGPMVMLITIAGLTLALGLAFLLEIMAAATRLNEQLLGSPVMKAEAAVPSFSAMPPLQPIPVPVQPPQWKPATMPLEAIAVLPSILDAGPVDSDAHAVVNWFESERARFISPGLAITSLGGGPGDAASLALALGRALAAAGRRTIIIDAAAAHSWFPAMSHSAAGAGLSDLIIGAADFTRVIVRDQSSTAHILRYGQEQSGQAKAMMNARLKPVLQALAQSYEVIIVHCGEAAQDTPGLIRCCGSALFMAPAHRAQDVAAAFAALSISGYTSAGYVQIGHHAPQSATPEFGLQAARG